MFISVITVCFNAQRVIEHTLQSVISQTYKNREYIVIDGNSNDGTQKLIEQNDSNIDYYLSECDRGIYDAMNKGIKAAKGDYILFMNAGDIFCSSSSISDWVSEINGRNADVYYGDVIYRYPYGDRYMKALPLYYIKKMMVFSHQSVLVSSKILKDRDFDISYRYAADYDCLLRCYLGDKTFLYTPIPISIVEMDKGATASNFCASKKEVLNIHKSCGYSAISRYAYFLSMMTKYYLHSTIKYVIPSSLIRKIQG